MAMIAMTTSNSISVKPSVLLLPLEFIQPDYFTVTLNAALRTPVPTAEIFGIA